MRRSNLHRSRTAPAMSAIDAHTAHGQQPPSASPGRPSIVGQAIVLLALYLSLGVLVYTLNRSHFSAAETHPVVDALYFCIVTMCTIGYGDITPSSPSAKIFSITFVLVGFGFVDILLSGMVSYVLDLQESLLLGAVANPKHISNGTAGAKHHHRRDVARHYIVDVKKGRMRIRMKVALALGVVLLCIGVGTAVLRFVERLGWLDSFYLSVMSVTTVGYRDHAFKTMLGHRISYPDTGASASSTGMTKKPMQPADLFMKTKARSPQAENRITPAPIVSSCIEALVRASSALLPAATDSTTTSFLEALPSRQPHPPITPRARGGPRRDGRRTPAGWTPRACKAAYQIRLG